MTGIIEVSKDGSDGVLVTFSDDTTAGYIAEELLGLRPIREKLHLKQLDEHSPKGKKGI